jgi:hypothetical protein
MSSLQQLNSSRVSIFKIQKQLSKVLKKGKKVQRDNWAVEVWVPAIAMGAVRDRELTSSASGRNSQPCSLHLWPQMVNLTYLIWKIHSSCCYEAGEFCFLKKYKWSNAYVKYISHTHIPAIATENLLMLFFSLFSTCFCPLGPSSGETQFITHISRESYRYHKGSVVHNLSLIIYLYSGKCAILKSLNILCKVTALCPGVRNLWDRLKDWGVQNKVLCLLMNSWRTEGSQFTRHWKIGQTVEDSCRL